MRDSSAFGLRNGKNKVVILSEPKKHRKIGLELKRDEEFSSAHVKFEMAIKYPSGHSE